MQKVIAAREEAARQARFAAGNEPGMPEVAAPRAPAASDDKENKANTAAEKPGVKVKRDFFGRIVGQTVPLRERDGNRSAGREKVRVWVKYHEGFNNAVRRPITLKDFMKTL